MYNKIILYMKLCIVQLIDFIYSPASRIFIVYFKIICSTDKVAIFALQFYLTSNASSRAAVPPRRGFCKLDRPVRGFQHARAQSI